MYNVAVDCGYFYFLRCLHLNFVKVFFVDDCVVSSSSKLILSANVNSYDRQRRSNTLNTADKEQQQYMNNDFVKATFSSG